MHKEVWKDIPEYEGVYQVSNLGNVRRKRSIKLTIKPRIKSRYKYRSAAVVLYKGGIGKETMVSRLVATAFVPNPEGKPFVNHKDFNATNNHFLNLEWVTRRENVNYSLKADRFKK